MGKPFGEEVLHDGLLLSHLAAKRGHVDTSLIVLTTLKRTAMSYAGKAAGCARLTSQGFGSTGQEAGRHAAPGLDSEAFEMLERGIAVSSAAVCHRPPLSVP